MGGMFALMGVAITILAWAMGVAMFLSGRWLAEHRNWTFCFVVACLSLLNQPLGTILGIFTLIVLARPSVKVLFQGSAAPTSPTRFPASIGPGGSPFDA
jgi:zinc transporter ZupT